MVEVPEHLLLRAAERKRQLQADRINRLEVEKELIKLENTPLSTRVPTQNLYWYNEKEIKKPPANGGFFENLGRKFDAAIRKVLKHGA